jgi:coenzyme F420-dependent glucose-6-phosphate dehydrogenase
VRNAKAAELAGLAFAFISDHFHPGSPEQGRSPFLWSVIGAITQATEYPNRHWSDPVQRYGCIPPLLRRRRTAAALMLSWRFMFGVGSGENLNEHIITVKWPSTKIRFEMLEEALRSIFELWKGGYQNHEGKYFRVEDACICSLPNEPPPLLIAATKKRASELAGKLGQGLIATKPDRSLIDTCSKAGRPNKPCYGQVTICWAESEEAGEIEAKKIWPNALVSGEASAALPLRRHFEQITEDIPSTMISSSGGITCGPSAEQHMAAIRNSSRKV